MLLAVSLTLSISVKAQNNNSATNRSEISTKSIGNEDNPHNYSMPSVYKNKLNAFIQDREDAFFNLGVYKYTVDFANKEMEVDWEISKDNQWLFVWHAIYGVFVDEDLYDIDDGDSKRLEEFDKTYKRIEDC